jgi:hypothetical protein
MSGIKSIFVSIKTFKRLGDEQKCREFINLLYRYNLIPLKYGNSDRPKYIFEEDELTKFWVDMEIKNHLGIPFIKGKEFHTSIGWGGAKPYGAWFMISLKILPSTDLILKFVKDLFQWGESCYGYVSYYEYKKKLYTPGMNIIDCLGDITWANLFGKPYTDMWGKEKLLNAPTWKTERLNDGGFILVTMESPLMEQKMAEKHEDKLKDYLGKKYFCRKPIQQETLTYDELLYKVAYPEPIVGYEAPDFSKYYDL